MKKLLSITIVVFSFILLASLPVKIFAMEFIAGESVSVPQDKVVDGSLFISGNSVQVNGEVFGDVFCAGKNVTITGRVHGDILCAGQSLQLLNVTDGNVRIAGQTIDISGTVRKNASVFGQTTTITETGKIDGELLSAAQGLRMDGGIGKDIQGWMQSASINGQVDRNITLDTESLSVGDRAIIGGNLTYTSIQNATIATGAAIVGNVEKHTPTPDQVHPLNRPQPLQQNRSKGIGFLFTTLLFGAILILLAPAGIERTLVYSRIYGVETFGRGLLVLVVAPVLFIVFIITLIGIPLAVVLGFLLAAVYVVGRIITTMLVGRLILESVYKKKANSLWWGLGVGTVILWALFTVPVLGGIASFLVTLFGFGAATVLLLPKTTSKH